MSPRHFAAVAALMAWCLTLQAAPDKKKIDIATKGEQAYLKHVRAHGEPGAPLIPKGGLGVGALPLIGGGNGCGPACLTGLALIESGLDAKDPVVAAIARDVRAGAFSSQNTYEISLMIMFLDRIGSKDDRGLIQFLTLRLMSGQLSSGEWTYTCEGLKIDPVEERQLRAELIKESKLTTPDLKRPKKDKKPREDLDDGSKTPKKEQPDAKDDEPKDTPRLGLLPALEKHARAVRPGSASTPFGGSGDHSNTQFATVALWCGRRHGVDVADTLAMLDKHYRSCQSADGGWAYTGGSSSSPAMTCAGLMGLAMGFGAKSLDPKAGRPANADEIAKDKDLENGLKYLGKFLKVADAEKQSTPNGQDWRPNDLSNNLYFMWSLERVGMVYGLKTIGEVDWYDWGSNLLLKMQNRDGSWPTDGFHSGTTENATAFALLFLSRSNLAEDISTSLKGKVQDPGAARLVAGTDLEKLLGQTGKGSAGSKRPDPKTPQPKNDTPSPVAVTDKAGKLAAALIAATVAERAALLTEYRDTKGSEYTDALARAASKSTGEQQAQIREALAQRLARMTAATLNEMMIDSDRELRRAAALAVGAKGKDRLPEFAAKLIRLIGDDEAMVVQAARTSLKALSDQDYGPENGASAADRGKALVAWRAWWDGQKK